MPATGGDITEITVNHPTLGSHQFFPKANEGNTFDPGGLRSNDDANQISGAGTMITQLNRVRGFFEALVENDMETREDLVFATDLAGSTVDAEWTAPDRDWETE